MFVGSGDLFDPWVPIEMRPVRIDVELGDRPSPGRAVLARFGPGGDREVALEAKDYMYRLVVTGAAGGYREGPWRPFIPGTSVSINVSEDFANGVFIVDSSSNLYASLYAVEYGQDAVARVLTLDASMTDADRRLLDLSVLVSKGPVSELCRDLRNSRT